MDRPVIIFGAKGLGKAALEIFTINGVVVYCFLDNDIALSGKEVADIAVLGGFEDSIINDIGKKCEAFIAVDDNGLKKTLVKLLADKRKTMPVNAVHTDISMASNVTLGHGNLINAGVVLGTYSTIGSHCILNTGSVVDYDVSIGDYVQVGSQSVINSGARIKDEVFIGSAVTVVSGIKIGQGARIGAGSVVIQDVKAGSTVFGNPATEIKDS